MTIYPITKKSIELLSENYAKKFNTLSLVELFDNLKLLGFYFATSAGISVSNSQLKTPLDKSIIFLNTYRFFSKNIKDWEMGQISEYNKYKLALEQWNLATELLKNKLVQSYFNNDPTNSIFMMSFSGARGNLSQVKQLIGARGLMADQSGNLIELPVLSNFKEGLTITDYIISSYGARKGVIDTALKTASAGYLTRRLVFLVEAIIIKDIDCKDVYGVNIFQKKKIFSYSAQKVLLKIKAKKKFKVTKKNQIFAKQNILGHINKTFLSSLSKNLKNIEAILVRSILSCKLYPSSCQKCYGIDYAKNRLILLGEAAGIIAAQSIGEPGTQLTMRTFHTGGAVNAEASSLLYSKHSGILMFSEFFKKSLKCVKKDNGYIAYLIKENITIFFKNWKSKKTKLKLVKNSLLFSVTSRFFFIGEAFGEQKNNSFFLNFVEFINQKKNISFYPFYATNNWILIPKNLSISNYFESKSFKDKFLINEGFFYSFSLLSSFFDKMNIKEIIHNIGVKIKNGLKINQTTISITFFVNTSSGFLLIKKDTLYLVSFDKIFKLNFLITKKVSLYFSYSTYLLGKSLQYFDKNSRFLILASLFLNKDNLTDFKLIK